MNTVHRRKQPHEAAAAVSAAGSKTGMKDSGASLNGSSHHSKRHTARNKDLTTSTAVAPSLQMPVQHVPGKLDEHFTQGQELGLGAFAHVFLGVHKATGQEYAIKKIDRAKMQWNSDQQQGDGDNHHDALQDEINSLTLVRDGPNIIQLYQVYEDQQHCYLVMELARGGELFDRILAKTSLSEREAAAVIGGIVQGIAYMHERRVAHRDLKPENLLLLTANPKDCVVKLADFGFAKKVVQPNGLRTLCGTPGYLAPEILERWPAYDTTCDNWSIGVILFLLLGGYLPFDDEDEDKVFERTRNGQYDFHPTYWKHISGGAKNLVAKLLTVNPKKRCTAAEALLDPWLLQGSSAAGATTTATAAVVANWGSAAPASSAAAATVPTGKVAAAIASQEANNAKAKQNAMKANATAKNDHRQGDRMHALKENFEGYLDRKKQQDDQHGSRVRKEESNSKRPARGFVEDSKTGQPFEKCYTLGDVLGEGGYACVYRATHNKTAEVYAVKDINTGVLESNSKSALRDEIAALKLLRGGPHIIRLFDVFEEPEHTFMIMEECKGGDLLTRISEKEVYTEREARKTCKILFQAMDYIHKKKVAHRDIKPENVLMVHAEDDTSIKIADFGFAKRVAKPNCLRTLCGTAQYVAPEVLDLQSAGYDQRADMWSVGVVVYILLGGYAPFEGPVQELARAICRGDYCFHDKYWADISEAAKDMISNMLQIDAAHRLSAEEALQCPWMTMEEESLVVKDLSGAQATLQKRQKVESVASGVINPINKYESLDVSFCEALGTIEEVAAAKAKRTEIGGLDIVEEESDYIEDSSSGKTFEELYQWGRLIGEGEFSVVHETRHRQSKERFAAKRVERNDLEPADAVALQDEISTLQMLSDSPFVVKVHDVFDEPDYTYIIMEKLKGPPLIERLAEKECYNENEGRIVMRRVLLGLEYCHNRRIANRNLKVENLLLAEEKSVVDVKITDFSFSKRVLYPNALVTQCGTEGYVSPEILEHRPAYDVQCDMWSLGVVMYILLGGYRPFRGEDSDDIVRQIRYGEYKFHKRYWKSISHEAKTLISRMLTVSPIGRITATAALQDAWFKMGDDDSCSD